MIIICVALEKEIPQLFKKSYPNHWARIEALTSGGCHFFADLSYLVVVTGVGEQSFLAIQWLIHHVKPSEIVNIGTAASTTFKMRDWVMLRSVSQGDHYLDCDLKTALPIPYHQYHIGSGITINQIDASVSGDCIDMEAYHMARACENVTIPFRAIKFITDHNNANTPTDFNANLHQFHSAFLDLLHHLFLPSLSISVIIPTYNRSKNTMAAIESVRNQSHRPNEIIVVDDGSEPAFECDGSPIHLIRLNENRGVSHARNVGIKHAASEWLAFLDSDDVWHTNHLASMANYLRLNSLCRWVQTDEHWIRNGTHFNKKAYHKKPVGWAFEPSLNRCLVSPSAVIIHRSLFDWHGVFDEHLAVCEDYDLWLRFLRYVPVGFSAEVSMTKFGGHADQLSTMFPAMDKFRLTALMKQWANPWPNIDRNGLISVIKQKCNILKQGALKRGRPTESYDAILRRMN
jgi:GT2 family glycosyltransferase/nucleoside phosphorylase